MITFMNHDGKRTTLCHLCRKDLTVGENSFAFAPGTISASGYFVRDYELGETVICPECTTALEGILHILAEPRLRNTPALITLEAA